MFTPAQLERTSEHQPRKKRNGISKSDWDPSALGICVCVWIVSTCKETHFLSVRLRRWTRSLRENKNENEPFVDALSCLAAAETVAAAPLVCGGIPDAHRIPSAALTPILRWLFTLPVRLEAAAAVVLWLSRSRDAVEDRKRSVPRRRPSDA